jgi:hypothetical protein
VIAAIGRLPMVRVQVVLEASTEQRYGLRGKRSALPRKPLTRNAFERVVLCNALGLTLRARVDAISEEPARIVALLTSTLQRHVRVCAKRQ